MRSFKKGNSEFWGRVGRLPSGTINPGAEQRNGRTVIVIMNTDIEEIREQIHELRNFLGPLDITISNLEAQIKANKADLERKNIELEMKIAELARRLELQKGNIEPKAPPHPTCLAPSEGL